MDEEVAEGVEKVFALLGAFNRNLAPLVIPVSVSKEIRFPLWDGFEMVERVDYMPNSTTAKVLKILSKPRSQEDLDEDLKLTIFSMGIEIETGSSPSLGFDVFIDKENPKYIEQTSRMRTQEDYNKLIGLVWHIHRNIQKGYFPPTGRIKKNCSEDRCAYFNVCDFKGGDK